MNDEKELILQLSSDKKSVKIQAIVKLTRAGGSQQAIDALIPFSKCDDREVSYFASQAIEKISYRIGIELDIAKEKTDLNAESDSVNPSDLTCNIFTMAKKEEIPKLLDIIRSKSELIPEEVMPTIANFLKKHGGITDSGFLEKQLVNANSNLILPFMSAAEAIAPNILARALPGLLASSEPLVRSRAISILRKIDPNEAERHFSDLLTSRDPENRLAGITISFLFPFDRVKGYILSILPNEHDIEVLNACQAILASNPELDTVLGILDCIDSVSPNQKSTFTRIIKAVCQAIATSRILPPEESTPQAIIKLWKQQRLESFLFDLEIQLPLADNIKKRGIIQWIEKNQKHEKVKELIERLAKNPQTEDVFNLLTRKKPVSERISDIQESLNDYSTEKAEQVLLENTSSQPHDNLEDSEIKEKHSVSNETEKQKLLRSLEIEDFPQNKSWLMETAKSEDNPLRAEVLTTLLRIHPDSKLLAIAKKTISSKHLETRTAAFKILEKLDSVFLKGKIIDMLQEQDPNLRIRVTRFGLKYKEKESIIAIKRLLKSNEQSVRSNAISCLVLCPIEKAFTILMDQLDTEEHPIIAKQIVNLLISNPSKKILKALDSITKSNNPAISMIISQAQNDLFEILSQMPQHNEQEPDVEERENDKPYSVSNVREIAHKKGNWKPQYKNTKQNAKQDNKEDKKQYFSAINWQLLISGSIVIIALAMLPIMLLSDKEPQKTIPKNSNKEWRVSKRGRVEKTKIPEKFRMNRPCNLSAIIEKVISDNSIVITHNQTQILAKFESVLPKSFKEGNEINITVIPYRVNPHGIILSRGQEITHAEGKKE